MAKKPTVRLAPAAERDRAANLFNSGRQKEAELMFRNMLLKNRNDVWAMYHMVLVHYQKGQLVEGLRMVDRAIGVAAHFAPCWYGRAMILQAMGEKTQALACYERAVQLQPDFQDALLNFGVLLRETWQHHRALECFERLLQLAPNHASALANCATLLDQMSVPERSIPMFERLVQVAPEHPYGLGMLAYDRLRSCDWRDADLLNARILDGVRALRQTCRPFALMAMPSTAHDHFLAARIFAQQRFPKAPIALWKGERYSHDRLRVGYVSPDFREHPVSHLMTGIFERHDRTRLETYALSIGNNDGSSFRTRLEGAFDHFLDLAALTPRLIAERARALEIDVLVDLAGFTSDGRPDIFSWRPAPVQVGFLGYPGTLGTDYMDHIVADRHVLPPEHQACYAEKVAYMPHTYLPTDADLQVAERTPTRAECGLPDTGPVLCAFSHNFKIHPQLFDGWMRLLRQVPDATLWLMGRKGPMQANLQREAAARGVDPARLVFAGRVPGVGDHLARYRLASLFLDTWPYNAHTTAADALLAGLPVVTLQGDAFPARVAASLLHAIGLPELVTQTQADYEALVLRLLGDPAALAALKAKLQANRSTQPLFDSERFTRDLEGLFLQLHAAGADRPHPATAPADADLATTP